MTSHGDKADKAAEGAEDGDATLAEVVMYVVVEEGGKEITDEGREEEQGYDGIRDVVVSFNLGVCQSGFAFWLPFRSPFLLMFHSDWDLHIRMGSGPLSRRHSCPAG